MLCLQGLWGGFRILRRGTVTHNFDIQYNIGEKTRTIWSYESIPSIRQWHGPIIRTNPTSIVTILVYSMRKQYCTVPHHHWSPYMPPKLVVPGCACILPWNQSYRKLHSTAAVNTGNNLTTWYFLSCVDRWQMTSARIYIVFPSTAVRCAWWCYSFDTSDPS